MTLHLLGDLQTDPLCLLLDVKEEEDGFDFYKSTREQNLEQNGLHKRKIAAVPTSTFRKIYAPLDFHYGSHRIPWVLSAGFLITCHLRNLC